MTTTNLDSFTRAYIECALWSSIDDNDEPMDREYSMADLAPETLAQMVADCERFQRENAELLISEYRTDGITDNEVDGYAGHDFWLTRCGHGCGFWDGDWSEPAATRLTEASKAYGECNLYVGDDGRIYA